MYFCYIDESGNTGGNLKDPKQPLLLLGCLLVPPDKIREIEEDIRVLGYGIFGAESRNTDFEFHGDDIYNARGRYFKKLDLTKRMAVFDSLTEIILKHDEMKIGYVCIEKEKYFGRLHVQQAAFHLLVEKLEEHLQGHIKTHCLLIADEQDELEQNLIDDLDHFKQHGTTFGYKSVEIHWIIDSVHFVRSHNSDLMQLSDVLCYLLRRGRESQARLLKEYHQGNSGERASFQDWVDQYPHRGYRYFYQTYRKISSRKPFLFAKDFPGK